MATTTRWFVNPNRDFYNKGAYYKAGEAFELDEAQEPPANSFEVPADDPRVPRR